MYFLGKGVPCGKSQLKIMPIVSCFKRLNKRLFLFITVDVTVQPQIKMRSRQTNEPPL